MTTHLDPQGHKPSRTARLARSDTFTLIARCAMIFASSIALPVGGFMMVKIISKAETIVQKVDSTAQQVELIGQSMQFRFDAATADRNALRATVSDHETRIRSVESVTRFPPIGRP